MFTAGLVGAASIFGLSACGGSDTSGPFQKYREQTVQWTACDPTILGANDSTIDELSPEIGARLRCGFVRAPLDWSTPERGDVVLAVMRLAAGTPEKRRGSLVFNPGGPGGDGLSTAFTLFSAFAQSNPDNPQGARQLRLLDEYDMVGFSPRGTGASTQFQCGTNELMRSFHQSAAEWDTPENIANIHYNTSKIAQACAKNPITPYINTDATARDIDLLRGLLGDEKLNYVGYSYGTWLGSWFASLFPEKVGRMVLDSSVDFTSTFEQRRVLNQPLARERMLNEVMIPYSVRHADYFQLGATDTEVRAIMPALSARVQELLGTALGGMGYSRQSANAYLRAISAARGLDTVLKAASDVADMQAIKAALDQHVFDPTSQEQNQLTREVAADFYWAYVATFIRPQPSSVALDSSGAVWTAVTCNDRPAPTELTTLAGLVRDVARRAPMFVAASLSAYPCSFWGEATVSKPELTPMKSLDVLMVQSQYDTATSTDGANVFFAELPAARRVYVSGDFQHGVYPYSDSCVDPIVTSYLLGESPSQREAVCAGHPLEQDALTPNARSKAASAPESPASAPPVYKDPERARELIEEFKRGLIPPQYRH